MKNKKLFTFTLFSILIISLTACEVSLEDTKNKETIKENTNTGHVSTDEIPSDSGYEKTNIQINAGEWQTHVYKTIPGVTYLIEWGATTGSVGLSVYASIDEKYDSMGDINIQFSHWQNIQMKDYSGDYLIIRVKGSTNAVYFIKILDAKNHSILPSGYHNDLPDSLNVKEHAVLNIIHNKGFKELFKVAPYNGGSKTIYGDSGNATISITGSIKKNYSVIFNNYKKNNIIVNGAYGWWTKESYSTVQNPSPKAGFYYDGGSVNGTLYISGSQNATVSVHCEMLNMESMNDSRYLFNDQLAVSYEIDGHKIALVSMMFYGLYKKTFMQAFNDLVENFDNLNNSTTQYGKQGGYATWIMTTSDAGAYTKQNESIAFYNYGDNGIILNGTISFYTLIDSYGNVLENPDMHDGGYDFTDTIFVTGIKEGTVNHNINIFKEGTTWNYSIAYTVEGLMNQFPFIRLDVGIGF